MTNEQSAIFRQILDLNYEINSGEFEDSYELQQMTRDLYMLKGRLMESMGFDAYNTFMNMGTLMFS